MDIHHAMIVRTRPERLYEALTEQGQLQVWMDAPSLAVPEVGTTVEFQYDQGRRTLKMEIVHLEENRQVKWRVIQPIWPTDVIHEITWTLVAVESSTAVDFRMDGWIPDDEAYASVSYKWALFMIRLKISLGDIREIASLLPIEVNK
jgi:uncharacterized protein YndB with AHSA1/START domain